MSLKIMNLVWGLDLPDSDKLVFLALADFADDQGKCWPSIATISKKCSKSQRTVQRAIQSLVESGHLTREERLGKGVFYHVDPRHEVTPDTKSPVTRCPSTPVTVTPKPSRTTNTSVSKDTSVKRARDKREKSEFVLPSHIPAEPWQGYVAMRRTIRKPLSQRAMELAVRQLDKLAADGWPPGDVLDQSTMNSWQGLFPVRITDERSNEYRATGQRGGKPIDGFIAACRAAGGAGDNVVAFDPNASNAGGMRHARRVDPNTS